jgi:polyisoprenoid-binding protein YceI
MKRHCCLAGFLSSIVLMAAGKSSKAIEIESGTASFEAATNMPGVEVKGVSSALSGQVSLSRDGDTLLLEQVRVLLPVKTLSTGMKVRDEHMRKYIFTTADGQAPDLEFEAGNIACPGSGAGDFNCAVTGSLSIRGTIHRFEIKLNVKVAAGSYHASGNGVVKLSDYGIERPSQFGVSAGNEVKVHLSLAGREKTPAATAAGAAQ